VLSARVDPQAADFERDIGKRLSHDWEEHLPMACEDQPSGQAVEELAL
jgi:hypothetical protein